MHQAWAILLIRPFTRSEPFSLSCLSSRAAAAWFGSLQSARQAANKGAAVGLCRVSIVGPARLCSAACTDKTGPFLSRTGMRNQHDKSCLNILAQHSILLDHATPKVSFCNGTCPEWLARGAKQ